MIKKKINKLISFSLAICMTLVYLPMGVFAEELQNVTEAIQSVNQKEESSEQEKIIKKTESSTVYQLEDGKKKEVIYDSNIRFKENGKLIDYDPSLVKIDDSKTENNTDISNYKYENNKGDKKNYLPEIISEETPIILEKEDYQITMSPINQESKNVKLEDEDILDIYDKEVKLPVKAVYEDKDEKTSLEYISQENGIKENIILNEVPQSNVFKYE